MNINIEKYFKCNFSKSKCTGDLQIRINSKDNSLFFGCSEWRKDAGCSHTEDFLTKIESVLIQLEKESLNLDIEIKANDIDF